MFVAEHGNGGFARLGLRPNASSPVSCVLERSHLPRQKTSKAEIRSTRKVRMALGSQAGLPQRPVLDWH
jgi:hypothetical protein